MQKQKYYLSILKEIKAKICKLYKDYIDKKCYCTFLFKKFSKFTKILNLKLKLKFKKYINFITHI